MLEAMLIILIGIALVAVYFSTRQRARKALQQFSQSISNVEPEFAHCNSTALRRWESAKGLLASARSALQRKEWDKVEELCQFGESFVELALKSVQTQA